MWPTVLYAFILLMTGISYSILLYNCVRIEGADSTLKKAIGNDKKGKLSIVLYAISLVCAYWIPWLALVIFAVVAIIWIIPDPRIEKQVAIAIAQREKRIDDDDR